MACIFLDPMPHLLTYKRLCDLDSRPERATVIWLFHKGKYNLDRPNLLPFFLLLNFGLSSLILVWKTVFAVVNVSFKETPGS